MSIRHRLGQLALIAGASLGLVAGGLSPGYGATTTTTTAGLAAETSSPTLGTVAGQDLDYCDDNVIEANDDGSSEAVDIPFSLKFFGQPYEQLYVNNNGNVTFDGPLGQYTPEDLTTDTGVPTIAPFFADVDTLGAGSSQVTYGSSPDGRTFCVDWADVGYFDQHDDKLNTFQLLLTSRDGEAGRDDGDFDITFNYDQVRWEAGDASDGENGLGGTSAAVGYSAGTGEDGTYFQLEGSLANGALLDGGSYALVSGKQSSTQNGRYRFEVRNAGLTSDLGSMNGSVVEAGSDTSVADAYVQACTSSNRCVSTQTQAAGTYSFAAVRAADYSIRVFPPSGSTLRDGGATATVTAGNATQIDPIGLSTPTPPPDGTTISPVVDSTSGIPSVYYHDDLTLTVHGCPSATDASYTVTLADGTVTQSGTMNESPAGSYSATIPELFPNTGAASVSTILDCAGSGEESSSFDIYIDPSGLVVDENGDPVDGATVTLLRSDAVDGPYVQVADGSSIMSASNRDNPVTTGADGRFHWDVLTGWYKVKADKTGCTSAHTDPMQVPPPRDDLELRLDCSPTAPPPPPSAPSPPTAVSATGGDGQASVTWSSPGNNGGSAITEYTVTAHPGGKTVTVSDRTTALVNGLTNGTRYTFTVTATNSAGTSTASSPSAAVTPRGTGKPVSRLFGQDRYATSAAVSEASFEPGVSVAYVATGRTFADALSGGAVAGMQDAPVLLVKRGGISAAVRAELGRLDPERIVVLGGSAAVSESVVNKLGGYTDGRVSRVFGQDRYATSAAVSEASFEPGVSVAYVATGRTFADALSGGAVAGMQDAPVLLVKRGGISAAVRAELGRLDPERIVVLGGSAAVSESVVNKLGDSTGG